MDESDYNNSTYHVSLFLNLFWQGRTEELEKRWGKSHYAPMIGFLRLEDDI
jgi:hypothetical protein